MKPMKKLTVLLLCCVMSVTLFSCKQRDVASGQKTIALSLNALDEFQTQWWGYFKEYGESQGYRMIMTNAEGKVDKQITDVESLIQLKPDVIIIRSTDSNGAVPAFEACAEAGIPTIDSAFGTNYTDTLKLITSQYELCAFQGQYCVDWLNAHPGENLRVGYIWGAQGMSGTADRYNGWKDTLLKGANGRATILAEKVCNWSAVETMAAVEDWLQAFPTMNCIVAMSDEMAIAASNVLQAAGKTLDDCIVIGIDGSANAQKSLRAGTLSASVYISTKRDAQGTVDYAARVMNGEDLRGKLFDLGAEISTLMTRDNLDAVLALEQ